MGFGAQNVRSASHRSCQRASARFVQARYATAATRPQAQLEFKGRNTAHHILIIPIRPGSGCDKNTCWWATVIAFAVVLTPSKAETSTW